MRLVLIDTSLMLDCARRKIDVFGGLAGVMDGPFEAVVPSGALEELKKKAPEKGAKGADARFALAMADAASAKNAARIELSSGHVDAWLLAKAKESDGIICTNDAELRRKAREAGLRVVSILHNSRLGFV